jgi:hypothetical protein
MFDLPFYTFSSAVEVGATAVVVTAAAAAVAVVVATIVT